MVAVQESNTCPADDQGSRTCNGCPGFQKLYRPVQWLSRETNPSWKIIFPFFFSPEKNRLSLLSQNMFLNLHLFCSKHFRSSIVHSAADPYICQPVWLVNWLNRHVGQNTDPTKKDNNTTKQGNHITRYDRAQTSQKNNPYVGPLWPRRTPNYFWVNNLFPESDKKTFQEA